MTVIDLGIMAISCISSQIDHVIVPNFMNFFKQPNGHFSPESRSKCWFREKNAENRGHMIMAHCKWP